MVLAVNRVCRLWVLSIFSSVNRVVLISAILQNLRTNCHHFDTAGREQVMVSKCSLSGEKDFLALTDLLVFTDSATFTIN